MEADLRKLLHHHLGLATDLITRCQAFSRINGASKLKKKCQAELRFLEGLQKRTPHELKESHLRSSNLASLEGIVVAMETLPNVTSILQPFQSPSPAVTSPAASSSSSSPGSACCRRPVVVDLVCNQGYTWVKVVARKAQALHLVWAGGGQFGERNIADQADEFLEVAQGHKENFKVPQILFIFTNGVTTPLRGSLTKMGIDVQGEEVPVDEDTQHKLYLANESLYSSDEPDDSDSEYMSEGKTIKSVVGEDEPTAVIQSQAGPERSLNDPEGKPKHMNLDDQGQRQPSSPTQATGFNHAHDLLTPLPEVRRINLDITTMISLVSNQCHGGCNYIFREEVLTRQAGEERVSPSLPKLKQFMQGKELFACETAVHDFRTILETVGGPNEKARAEELLASVRIVPDQPSDGANQLNMSARVKDRAKNIFGTGDTLQAITMSANVGFIRAAANQGVKFAIFLHEPRALTEQKEASATPYPASPYPS